MGKFYLAIDQSTQGTKGLLFDEDMRLVDRVDKAHRQLVNDFGWVEHDPEEIFRNILCIVKELKEKHVLIARNIKAIGISNQRETTVFWDKDGKPLRNAIVWQDGRAAEVCNGLKSFENEVKNKTGIKLSPFFPAAKIKWVLNSEPEIKKMMEQKQLFFGTVDTYLLYRLTGGKEYKTDYSNASRTQLFNIHELKWDEELCGIFGVDSQALPEVNDSDALFGYTDFDGLFEKRIPINAMLGDSHAALFGQRCNRKGMAKATYGTGTSVMMNLGQRPAEHVENISSTIGWKIGGDLVYCAEGNINYSGAIISWLKDALGLIDSPKDTAEMAKMANTKDKTYLVPAFSGLGAPYWRNDVKAAFIGMSRTTGKNELVKAGIEAIAYQISDLVIQIQNETGCKIKELMADGGASKNEYLMQFQADILDCIVNVSEMEEISAYGVALAAKYTFESAKAQSVQKGLDRTVFFPNMQKDIRNDKYTGWKAAVKTIL